MPVVGRITGLVSLSLDGVACGFVRSVSGGDISAPVLEEKPDPAGFVQKRLGTPAYEDIALQVGLGMGPALYDWIAATWARNFERKDGAIAATDVNLQVKSNREFLGAQIGAVTFPALDIAAKDTAFLTVTLTPASVMTATASGSLVAPQAEKKWLPANFRLELDGIDCSRVSRIDSFTVTVETGAAQAGGPPAPHVEPSTIDFPNLSVTVAEAGAQSWIDWFDGLRRQRQQRRLEGERRGDRLPRAGHEDRVRPCDPPQRRHLRAPSPAPGNRVRAAAAADGWALLRAHGPADRHPGARGDAAAGDRRSRSARRARPGRRLVGCLQRGLVDQDRKPRRAAA